MKADLAEQFVFADKTYYKSLINNAHVMTAHGRVEKTTQYLTHRYQSHSLSALVQSFVASCDTCHRVKQFNKPPLEFVTPLHVLVRPCTDLWIDVLNLTPVFIKCSTMYANREIDNDHMLCILHIWTIVDRHSGYTFLIPIPHNFKAEQCSRTYEVHLLAYIGYTNIIVFYKDS